jgi:hypothetical protein
MVKFTATLDRFGKYKEKSGWTFIPISSARAQKLSSHKTAFRVKGKIDDVEINQVALVPMGDGDFILPVNGIMRKKIQKAAGDKVRVEVEYDPSDLQADQDFLDCLMEAPGAVRTYDQLPQSHKNYFTKWLQTAKTQATKADRIALAVSALSRGLKFNEMLREKAGKPF